MSKLFCTNHEGFCENKPCGKCGSDNVFGVGVNTRFPKHPKKRDYIEIFSVLISRAKHRMNLEQVQVIHDYISNHKYRNSSPHDTFGRNASTLSYKETMQDVLKKAKVKKIEEHNDYYPGFNTWEDYETVEEIAEVINFVKTPMSNGWYIPAFDILLRNGAYNKDLDKNYFKPIRQSYIGLAFKTEKDAKIVSTYLAQQGIKQVPEDDGTIFWKYMRRTANKTKLNLRAHFPEAFI